MKQHFRISEEAAKRRVELSDLGDEYDTEEDTVTKTNAGLERNCFPMVHDTHRDKLR